MRLSKWIVAIFLIGLSPLALAMTLGEGQILNRVGEAFSASIALNGSYSKDVTFSLAGSVECRSADIGTAANGCASLYTGSLSFSTKQGPDGRYFLSVTGEKGNELFYRVLIKSTSSSAGSVFKIYEFLPEFNQNPDESPVVDNDVKLSGHDVAYAKSNQADAGSLPLKADMPKPAALRHETTKHKQSAVSRSDQSEITKHKQADEIKGKKDELALKKSLQTHLEIKKSGEYADEIQALSKENGEIEAQISLLEKHIGLLKEVIRLKSEAGAIPKPSAVLPKVIPLQIQTVQSNQPGLLTWILLAVVVVLAVLLIWMSLKIKRLSLTYAAPAPGTTQSASVLAKENKSLDLTDTFTKAKW